MKAIITGSIEKEIPFCGAQNCPEWCPNDDEDFICCQGINGKFLVHMNIGFKVDLKND